MASEAGAAPSVRSAPQFLFPEGTAPPPALHPSAPPLNSSYPGASTPCVEQPVSGKIFVEPLEPVHVCEEKGSSPVRKKEKDGCQIREKKRRKKGNNISAPSIEGTILPGITRKSTIEVVESKDYKEEMRL
ncbi:uncharacterized protein LOC124653954 [Lolium rigidum]|uniref:uncharacterized protein LOC124653954 n=1 Tax=Lolium rigidum TaxID=89674 RepID=UPI001F5E1782|nr:uncharacterized protein LOC124653954 [Lolium rigidum]